MGAGNKRITWPDRPVTASSRYAAGADGLIRRTARRARRVASVCAGAFLLAEAGLLDGRRATTHWAVCDALQRRYPRVYVERDPIFVRDGNVVTSAGITTGIDLAPDLVEQDCGREVALDEALEIEAGHFARMVPTQDIREGITAWRERRTPQFTGA